MSDGISDAYRMQDEAAHTAAFYTRFILALKEKCVTRADVITKLVNDADEGRVFGRHADSMKKIMEIAAALKAKDERAWAKFIRRAGDAINNPEHLETLLKLSPFKKTVPLRVKYGYGFVRLDGPIEAAIAKRLQKEGKATYNADDYMVFIPQEVLDKAQIVWLDGPEATPIVADRPKRERYAA